MKLGAALLTIALALDQTNWLGSFEWIGGVAIVLIGYALVFERLRRPGSATAATSAHPESAPQTAVVDG